MIGGGILSYSGSKRSVTYTYRWFGTSIRSTHGREVSTHRSRGIFCIDSTLLIHWLLVSWSWHGIISHQHWDVKRKKIHFLLDNRFCGVVRFLYIWPIRNAGGSVTAPTTNRFPRGKADTQGAQRRRTPGGSPTKIKTCQVAQKAGSICWPAPKPCSPIPRISLTLHQPPFPQRALR